MKIKIIVSLLLVITSSLTIQAQQRIIINKPEGPNTNIIQPLPNFNGMEPKIDKLLRKYMDLNLFSGVVVVAKEGEPIYNKAFGQADIEAHIPVNTETRFDIGSMNKAFTKAIVLNLIYEGKLNLNDNLGKYLIDFPEIAAKKVTIEQLINHTSGFGDYHTPEYERLTASEKTIENILKIARSQDLLFTRGTNNSYSNIGYVLLGAIIQKVEKKPYNTVVKNRILTPLRLNNTFLDNKYRVSNRAVGYNNSVMGALENTDYLQIKPTPAGSFMASSSDLLKFFHAYYYGEKLWKTGAKSLDTKESKYLKEIESSGGAAMIAGGFPGVNTVNLEVQRDGFSVLVLSNRNPPSAIEVGIGVLEIIRGKEPMEPEIPVTQILAKAYFEKGKDYVKKNFNAITQNMSMRTPKEDLLNQIGYSLLQSGTKDNLKNAIGIFLLNTELFPDVANTWDSYGEALLIEGDKSGALKAYEKALSLDPSLKSSIKAVHKLIN
ncbi:MAG: serine hydrolase [Flavobacteriaceae bacterium]|nr:serine hydrolase [Flavobacteriaceae bacterium]